MPVDLLLTRIKNAPKRWKKREQERKERIKLKKSGEIDKSKFSEKYIKEMEARRNKKKKVNPKGHKIPGEFSGTKEEFNKKYGLDKKNVKKEDKKDNKDKKDKKEKKVEKTRLTKEERFKHEQIAQKEKQKIVSEKKKKAEEEKRKYRRTKGEGIEKKSEGYRGDTRITRHLKKSGWSETRLAEKRKAHAEWKAKRKNRNKLKKTKGG